MRIFAIGRNYAAHIAELKNEAPSEPVVFTKPDTAILRENAPFYYPDFSRQIQHEVEIVLKISKEGKNIDPKFAHRYYDEIGLGIDFTAHDLQNRLKEKGLPWDLAKGFNGSAPISEFLPKTAFPNLYSLNFHLDVNNERRQTGDTKAMIFNYDVLIAFISRYFTLRKGDLLFTGTPQGVAEVKPGDRLKAYLEDRPLLNFEVL